jgi:HEAT repeat protein
MRSSRPLPILAAVVVIAGLAAWLLLSNDDPGNGGGPPARGPAESPSDVVPPPEPPGVFSPEAVSTPLDVPAAAPADGPAEEADEDPRLTSAAGYARVAMERARSGMSEFGDVEAFLAGRHDRELTRIQVPRESTRGWLELLEDEAATTRMLAALALSVVELPPEDLAILSRSLERELTEMRTPAEKNVVLALTYALHTHGDPGGLRRLETALRGGEGAEVRDFRNGAAFVLALAADGGSSAVLRELVVSDPDRLVRKHAAVGLGRIGGDENRDALGTALPRETDLEVRAWAALALGRATPDGSAVDPALVRALADDPAGEVRGAAAFAVSKAGGETVGATLREAFYRDDHDLARIGAVAGLARRARSREDREFLTGEGTPFLMEAARGSEDRVSRHYAVRVLAGMPPAGGRGETLRHVAARDASAWVRGTAVDALVATEGADAVPFLEERLAAEPSEGVRKQIEGSVALLTGGK